VAGCEMTESDPEQQVIDGTTNGCFSAKAAVRKRLENRGSFKASPDCYMLFQLRIIEQRLFNCSLRSRTLLMLSRVILETNCSANRGFFDK